MVAVPVTCLLPIEADLDAYQATSDITLLIRCGGKRGDHLCANYGFDGSRIVRQHHLYVSTAPLSYTICIVPVQSALTMYVPCWFGLNVVCPPLGKPSLLSKSVRVKLPAPSKV
ncbi:hypothetical protein B0G84_8620 [Paraburkholderia sp. BL8N3]|nr:hypothetical protein B0G84_8620 [Paraburkholderia sp. BL8N3]